MRLLALCLATTVAAIAAASLLSTRPTAPAPSIKSRRSRTLLAGGPQCLHQRFPVAFSVNEVRGG